MASVYTVAQITAYIKHMFEQDFALNRVSVKGEVSNCKYHSSGHLYFTLKDSAGAISCIMFAGSRNPGDIRLRDGLQVIANGIGDLYRMFEARRRELEEMGMFASEYKKPIPRFCATVGIVTAETGAAIRDIINIASRRNPYVQLILCPAQVQGAGAASSIVHAIETLDELGLDCMIVGRGGGSIEDLWAFNEESVARAIFSCDTPVISAVGHETDFTIADFVADLRAPTPSAAAELAVYDYEALMSRLLDAQTRLDQAMGRRLEETNARVEKCLLKLQLLHPESRIQKKKEQLQAMEAQLFARMADEIRRYRYQLGMKAQKLDAISPLKRLSGGYALITDETEQPLEGIGNLAIGQPVRIHMKDGIAAAAITEIQKRTITDPGTCETGSIRSGKEEQL